LATFEYNINVRDVDEVVYIISLYFRAALMSLRL